MKCPYCTSEISQEALACPFCTHDVFLVKSLQEKIEALEKAILEMRPNTSDSDSSQPAAAPIPASIAVQEPPPSGQPLVAAVMLWLGPLMLLLLAHSLITVVFDLSTIYLRVASLLIPLPFGFVLMSRGGRHLGYWGGAAFLMAVLAALGMSSITHLVDQSPVLPQNLLETREFIEYAMSVAFSYTVGMLIGRMVWRRLEAVRLAEQSRGLSVLLSKLILDPKATVEQLQAMSDKLNSLGSSLATAAATAASIYTGLHNFIN